LSVQCRCKQIISIKLVCANILAQVVNVQLDKDAILLTVNMN
jgi:hypothetical protein